MTQRYVKHKTTGHVFAVGQHLEITADLVEHIPEVKEPAPLPEEPKPAAGIRETVKSNDKVHIALKKGKEDESV